MDILWKPSPNYWTGRGGERIEAIVDHIAEGYAAGLNNEGTRAGVQKSWHYAVMRDGTVVQYVADEHTAWHAGMLLQADESLPWLPGPEFYRGSKVNQRTIGIEHEGFSGQPMTEAQFAATVELHRLLIDRHGIPVDRDHIVGHYRLDSVNRARCPGDAFPWDALFAALKGEDMPTLIDSMTLIWDRLDRIQKSAAGQTSEDITSLAEEAKQQGVVEMKKTIGIQ